MQLVEKPKKNNHIWALAFSQYSTLCHILGTEEN